MTATPQSAQPARLANRFWPGVDVADILLLPVGSTEQHGPHLPIGTDTIVATTLADLMAGRRGDVIVAPAIPYGSSGEHAAFAGTLSMGTPALAAVVTEIVRSSAFARTVVVNGHGGNTEALAAAEATLTHDGHDVLFWSPRMAGSDGGDSHAGHVETSLLLAVDAAAVGPHRSVAGNSTPLATLMPDLVAGRLRTLSPTGVLGDPRGADAAAGAALWERWAADLAAAVERRWPR